MAQYIKLRLTAAKVGVSMAFLALLAGLAEKARATPSGNDPIAGANFLTELSTPTGAGLSRAVVKLDSALVKLEHRLATSFETTKKLDRTFLKIKAANTEFLKIRSADTTFLKIEDANANFLKLDAANSEFLKIDATASNASELGGLRPSSFVQGHGDVVSGATSLQTPGSSAQLMAPLAGGIIVVTVSLNSDSTPIVTIHNNGSVSLPAVQDGAQAPITIRPGAAVPITLTGAVSQLHLQIFPNGAASPDVVTLTVSCIHAVGGVNQFAGQALSGAG